jgi:acyl carrier protein
MLKPYLQLSQSQMERTQIEAKVRVIVADLLDVDESQIHSSSRFREDLGADSLDIVNLIMAFSNAFEADIRDADVLYIQTIGEAIDYLARNLISRTNIVP